jgi:hypothetical protein
VNIYRAIRDRRTTTLELSASQLQNLFNFMKGGRDLYMPWQDIKAKTGVDGILRFEITVSNDLIRKITPDAALDAITNGLL